jgi:hypothetical protein
MKIDQYYAEFDHSHQAALLIGGNVGLFQARMRLNRNSVQIKLESKKKTLITNLTFIWSDFLLAIVKRPFAELAD